MKKDISYFASDGYSPGLSGLSGYAAGQRVLSNTGKPYTTGEDVKFVQGIVGTTIDGAYGPQTQAAVEQFQRNNGLTATGVVDAATWAALKDGNSNTDGSILSQKTTDFLNWVTGDTEKVDGALDKISSAFISASPDDKQNAQKEENTHCSMDRRYGRRR